MKPPSHLKDEGFVDLLAGQACRTLYVVVIRVDEYGVMVE
jgi:hypothetical protein